MMVFESVIGPSRIGASSKSLLVAGSEWSIRERTRPHRFGVLKFLPDDVTPNPRRDTIAQADMCSATRPEQRALGRQNCEQRDHRPTYEHDIAILSAA